jgi:hypothetical protein
MGGERSAQVPAGIGRTEAARDAVPKNLRADAKDAGGRFTFSPARNQAEEAQDVGRRQFGNGRFADMGEDVSPKPHFDGVLVSFAPSRQLLLDPILGHGSKCDAFLGGIRFFPGWINSGGKAFFGYEKSHPRVM